MVLPGGIVAAAVWTIGGLPAMRWMWDTVAVLDEEARRQRHGLLPADDAAGRDAAELRGPEGLAEVEEHSLDQDGV